MKMTQSCYIQVLGGFSLKKSLGMFLCDVYYFQNGLVYNASLFWKMLSAPPHFASHTLEFLIFFINILIFSKDETYVTFV